MTEPACDFDWAALDPAHRATRNERNLHVIMQAVCDWLAPAYIAHSQRTGRRLAQRAAALVWVVRPDWFAAQTAAQFAAAHEMSASDFSRLLRQLRLHFRLNRALRGRVKLSARRLP